MRCKVHIVLLVFVVFVAATMEASAQKYPERRTTRQGNRAYNRGDMTTAEQAYRRALELNPRLSEAQFNLGNALFRQEKGQESVAAWMSVAADSLTDARMVAEAGFNLGNAALAGQKIDEAIEFYKQSLRLSPDDMQAKYNLAYAQKLKQEQEQENQNQNQDQDQQNDEGGDDDSPQDNEGNDDKNDQQNDGQDDDKNDNQDENDDNQEGGNDGQDGDGEDENDAPPPPSGQGEGTIDPRTAEQMLDAMQAEEDKTREDMNAREAQVEARSGKNW